MLWRKLIKVVLVLSLISLVIIQFIRPEKNNGGYESVLPFENETRTSSKVAAILKENCYDCHSNQTKYPWYSEIAPISYFLENHVKDGKKHFNVSVWQQYSIKKKEHKLEEVMKMIEENKMPLQSYTLLHGSISADEKIVLMQWAGLARLLYKHNLEVSSN